MFFVRIYIPCIFHVDQRNGVAEEPCSAGAGEVRECPGTRRKYRGEELLCSPGH